MTTKFCPRCKEQRMTEWFGERHAPYAICLSCRVEVNGERKTEKQERRFDKFRQNCAICNQVLLGAPRKVCEQCETGLRAFNHNPALLGRATAFVGGNLRQPKKAHKKKRLKVRNNRLHDLIRQQAIDDKERGIRFEHAISK